LNSYRIARAQRAIAQPFEHCPRDFHRESTKARSLINVSARCEGKIIKAVIDLPTRSVGLPSRGEGHRRLTQRNAAKAAVRSRYIFFFLSSLASRPLTKDSGPGGRDGDPYMLSASLIYVHQFRTRRPRVRSVLKNFNARRLSSILPFPAICLKRFVVEAINLNRFLLEAREETETETETPRRFLRLCDSQR